MINDSMLKYYLNKCLKVPKDKFRLINKEEECFPVERIVANRDINEHEDEDVTVVKVIYEIVDD